MLLTLSSKLQLTKLSDEVQDDGYAFEAVILSGEPIDHWNRFVIDLSSITPHKPRLTVDYNHNDELIIGYGENFHVTPEGLKSTGKLTPGSFADEIVKHWKSGVPFEASVVIDLNNAIETRVGADQTTVVNGRTYQGPISVYTNVPLEGYSICPHGADKFTNFTLLKKEIDYTMPKITPQKLTPKQPMKLSDDEKEKDENLSQDKAPSVKNQELADFCEMFGEKNGMALYQSGADIAEAKQWQALNEKYSQYLANDDEDDPPADPPADDNPTKEDDDDEKLSAALTKLNAKIDAKLDALSTAVTKLQAAMPPKGADPVSHNGETPSKPEAQNSIQRLAASYKCDV